MSYIGNKQQVALYDSYTKGQAEGTFAPITRSRKNLLINGDFRIWQRGTTFTDTTGYVADRWFCGEGGGAATTTQEAFGIGQTEVPGNPEFYLRYDQTVAGTGTGTPGPRQRIENVRTAQGKSVVVSFWAKGTDATPIIPRFAQLMGDGTSVQVDTFADQILLTTSWKKYEVKADIPSIAGQTLGDNNYIEFLLYGPPAGVFTLDLAQVQFEEGDTATDFEYRPLGEELALCKRYYELGDSLMYVRATYTTGDSYIFVPFAATKRRVPTVTRTGAGSITSQTNGTTTSVQTVDGFYFLNASLVVGGTWAADAEL